MTIPITYFAADIHARHTVLGCMNTQGDYLNEWRLKTTESELIRQFAKLGPGPKKLAIEESSLAYWFSQLAYKYFDEILICDPRKNALISRSAHKSDSVDTYKLCRLLRLGELKKVYHPLEDHRAIFKSAAQHYLDLTDDQVKIKQRLKAKFRTWGVPEVDGDAIYSKKGRNSYLSGIKASSIKNQLVRFYSMLDNVIEQQEAAFREMIRLGKHYPEIKEFMKLPGIGPVVSHVFDAFVQTPDRFRDKRQLWRYSRLGVTDRTSDGKPLGFKRLDRSGNSELKTVSYRTFLSALRAGNNVVQSYYQHVLEETHNHVHARLTTQRKILTVLWTIWKRKEAYRPELFFSISTK